MARVALLSSAAAGITAALEVSMVQDIHPGNGGSNPESMKVYNDKLYFGASDGTHGKELWVYDGTTASMVKDINPCPAECGIMTYNSSPESMKVYNDKLYFRANNDTHGKELWVYDGTDASMVQDINPGNGNSYVVYPGDMKVYNNKLYFEADDGTHGNELWVYDGTAASMVQDIEPGNGGSSPSFLTVHNDKIYFRADDGTHGNELWVYDGTAASMVQDINPGNGGSSPSYLTVYNEKLYFGATDGTHGKELWVLGTPGISPPSNECLPFCMENATVLQPDCLTKAHERMCHRDRHRYGQPTGCSASLSGACECAGQQRWDDWRGGCLCFPSSALVDLVVPADVWMTVPVRIDTLRVGDRIVAAFADGRIGSDVVSRFSIADSEGSHAFVTITTDANSSLSLTEGHRVAVGANCCMQLKQAKDLARGDTIWLKAAPGRHNALVAQRVVTLDVSIADGLHNPLLMHGGLPIVDGVVTSFNSWPIVSLDSLVVPPAETLCAATGLCDSLRSLVAKVECATKHLFITDDPVCKSFHYIDGLVVPAASATDAGLGAVAVGITAAFLISARSSRRLGNPLAALASLPLGALTVLSSATKAGATLTVQGYLDANCTTESSNWTSSANTKTGCISGSGQSVVYDCSGDLVAATLYTNATNCSGSRLGAMMSENVSAIMKQADTGLCVANMLSYPFARVVSGSLCSPPLPSSTEGMGMTEGMGADAIVGISVGGAILVVATIVFGAVKSRRARKVKAINPS